MNPTELNGVLNVLKPTGMTSHDVIYFIRRTLAVKKAGHTGTLDPGVSGVLPICIGKATRIIEFLEQDTKAYQGEVTLGAITDSQDGSGKVLAEKDASMITEQELRNTILSFIGPLEQIPPMVSAVKINGKKLYELAREGIEIERKPRRITVHSIDILKINGIGTPHPKASFDIKCSKGTYIRTICHDIGQKMGVGGYMSDLVRTASGKFHIESSIGLEEIKALVAEGRINEVVLSIEEALPLEPVWIKDSAVEAVKHGNRVYKPGLTTGFFPELEIDMVKLMNSEDKCLAVARMMKEESQLEVKGEDRDMYLQPVKVF